MKDFNYIYDTPSAMTNTMPFNVESIRLFKLYSVFCVDTDLFWGYSSNPTNLQHFQ